MEVLQLYACSIAKALLGSLKERDYLEDQGADGRMASEWILGRLAGGVSSRFSWLKIGISDRLL
jgi:hypothetical protein